MLCALQQTLASTEDILMIQTMPKPNPCLLAPSILAGDHANLGASLAEIESAGLKWVHLDIMDGHFVPNLSFGPQTVKALRPKSELFFDVHLMLDNPDQYIDAFVDAGADQISIHVEPDYPVARTLDSIRSKGLKCGVVLNPDTLAEAAKPYLQQCDLVLCMTVQPGFGGQSFRRDVLPKIKEIAALRTAMGLEFRLEVDGGVDAETAPLCAAHGADTLVAGTSFYKAADRAEFIQAVTGG
ncbi:MAG: ribulose-phosphate 3-epimerase [Opitutales bacterium]